MSHEENLAQHDCFDYNTEQTVGLLPAEKSLEILDVYLLSNDIGKKWASYRSLHPTR